MDVIRGLGWLLVVVGVVFLGGDVMNFTQTGAFAPISLYDVWIEMSRTTLDEAQGVIPPWLWPFIRSGLALWATPAFVVFGFALVWTGRDRREADPSYSTRSPS